MDAAAVAQLVQHARTSLGPPAEWMVEAGKSDALAMAVLDAFWSPDGQSDRDTVEHVLELYRELRDAEWGDADTDGAREFLAQFEILGGPAYFAEQLKKRAPDASSRKAVLSSAGALEACELLVGADLTTAAEMRAASPDALGQLERAWKRIAGQRSGETFQRVLLLIGCPTVTPDRRLIAFVGNALGSEPAPDSVGSVLAAVAAELGVPAQALAHRIRSA
jgi:hypothetical protein